MKACRNCGATLNTWPCDVCGYSGPPYRAGLKQSWFGTLEEVPVATYEQTLDELLVEQGAGIFIPDVRIEFRKMYHDRLRHRYERIAYRARTLVARYQGVDGVIFWAERK